MIRVEREVYLINIRRRRTGEMHQPRLPQRMNVRTGHNGGASNRPLLSHETIKLWEMRTTSVFELALPVRRYLSRPRDTRRWALRDREFSYYSFISPAGQKCEKLCRFHDVFTRRVIVLSCAALSLVLASMENDASHFTWFVHYFVVLYR